MANYDLIILVFSIAWGLSFAFLGLMFVHEVVRQVLDAWRHWRMSDEERAEMERWSAGGFNLRRAGSELRFRHVHKPKVTGRTSELNKQQHDPYAP